jgi:cobalt-zinc-cadmium efflux system membrane fusion protein
MAMSPRRIFAAAAALAAVMVTGGCHSDATSRETPPPAATAAPVGRVHLDPSQLGQVRVEELSTHAPADALKATGTVEFNTDRLARIVPPVNGQVQDLKVNVGDTVRKGDVLFVLSSREVASAIADYLASRKDAELSEKTYAMTKDLFEHQAASRIALSQSENDLAKAKAKVQQTAEVLQVLGVDAHAAEAGGPLQARVPVRSPIGGTVTDRNLTNGQFVGNDPAPVMTIADLSRVWVQADVFERDLHSITPGQKALVTTSAYPDDRFSAEVSRIGTTVDAQTRTAKVRFAVANPGGRLKPGMFTTMSLYLPQSASVLTVPIRAVFVEGGRSFAYLQVGPQEFARREIETAAGGAERVRIVSGLKAGDRVISDGVLLLRQREADGPAR